MNKLLVVAAATLFPLTASFAAGINVNLHNVAAAKMPSLPALSAMAARGNALGSLPKLGASPAISLPGIPELPIGLPPKGEPNGWLPYDVHVWPGLFGSYLFHTAQYVRDGVKFGTLPEIQGDLGCDSNPDCGGFPPDLVNQGFSIGSGIEKIIVGGLIAPVKPRPRFPPAVEQLVFGG
jgi:hypothetical protein